MAAGLRNWNQKLEDYLSISVLNSEDSHLHELILLGPQAKTLNLYECRRGLDGTYIGQGETE